MSPREELLEALQVERYDQHWWKYRAPPRPEEERVWIPPTEPLWDDSEITTARRVRELLGDAKTNKEEVA